MFDINGGDSTCSSQSFNGKRSPFSTAYISVFKLTLRPFQHILHIFIYTPITYIYLHIFIFTDTHIYIFIYIYKHIYIYTDIDIQMWEGKGQTPSKRHKKNLCPRTAWKRHSISEVELRKGDTSPTSPESVQLSWTFSQDRWNRAQRWLPSWVFPGNKNKGPPLLVPQKKGCLV